MRIGIIDLGTNSTRLDIYDVSDNLNLPAKKIYKQKVPTRLGDTVFTEGKISDQSATATIEALKLFLKEAEKLGVDQVKAVGTSALREASNRAKFCADVKAATQLEINVISGTDEANFIAHALLALDEFKNRSFILIDIGGGSTELAICQEGKIIHSHSFQLGALRLQKTILKTTPPAINLSWKESPIGTLRHTIRSTLSEQIVKRCWEIPKLVIGSSGAIKTLARINEKNWNRKQTLIQQEQLAADIERWSGWSLEELMQLPGIDERRADILLAGSIILDETLLMLKSHEILVTDCGLREGYVEYLRRNSKMF
jgi:exopolyphosphatase/guanosine-5'-triphosphate,3'-diphosphate pyrophosphatase